jgi:EAL domain-containing protein (putative c-di-GMP-specific phosphodiesterase class I)
VLEAEGFPPEMLCLEVTDGILTDASAIPVLASVRKLGVHVAIDDFGVGYSSLTYLRRLPADIVKLDRDFLLEVDADTGGGGFVTAVVALAHAAGMQVVFERIDTQMHLDVALAAGADMVQGFLLAPPLSASAADDFVVQHRQTDDRRAVGTPLLD